MLLTPPPAPPDLWARLEALELDGGAALSFSQRLARDNGWSGAYARRVVLEYKKFVFLAATCDHPVTPSDEVDQAWHLHLVYTRSYWDELCGQVLGFALHHGPTRGGAVEGHKFRDWYARTLAAYAAAFGTAPPPDVWPPAAVRFGEAPYFQRVNLRRQWLLPRPRWPFSFRPGRREGLALAGALLLAGCTARTPINPLNWYGPEFLGLYWGLCATVLPLAVWWRRRSSGPEETYAGPPPGTYALARLADRGQRVADAALAALVHTGQAELVPERRIKRATATPPTDPYECAVWHLIGASGWSNVDALRKRALAPNIGALRALDAALEPQGLLLSPAERIRLNQIPLLAALGLGVLGLVKVLVGLSRDRPVGLLVLSLFGLGLGMAMFYLNFGVWATGRGNRLLRDIAPHVRRQQRAGPLAGATVALSVALFGVAELHNLGLGTLATHLLPPPQDAGGGGDGGGDGGSGCGGGGCGGCGGCGGD